MLVLSQYALMLLGIAQAHSLGARDEQSLITLPHVPGIPSRFKQRDWQNPRWRGWDPEYRRIGPTKPRRLFASSVRLIHMRGGALAIRDAD